MEKVLKAHVCKKTLDLAPRIHNLIRLAELSSLELSQVQKDLLAELNHLTSKAATLNRSYHLPH